MIPETRGSREAYWKERSVIRREDDVDGRASVTKASDHSNGSDRPHRCYIMPLLYGRMVLVASGGRRLDVSVIQAHITIKSVRPPSNAWLLGPT